MRASYIIQITALALGLVPVLISSAKPSSLCRLEDPSSLIPSVRLKPVIKGLKSPIALVNAGDGGGRLFVVEQKGIIRVLKNGRLLKKPFLDIRSRVTSGGEKGLLGLVFHPRFSENGHFSWAFR